VAELGLKSQVWPGVADCGTVAVIVPLIVIVERGAGSEIVPTWLVGV